MRITRGRVVSYEIRWGLVTDRGKRREENQDSVLCWSGDSGTLRLPSNGVDSGHAGGTFRAREDSGGFLAAVADGMGGLPGGAQASRVALESVGEFLDARGGVPGSEEAVAALVDAANKAVLEASRDPRLLGMGCTLTLLALTGNGAFLGHVGDSVAFEVLPGREGLLRLTREHTRAAELVERGRISEEAARRHPDRNVLTEWIGKMQGLTPQVQRFPLPETEAVFLLCSDGLTKELEEDRIEESLRGVLGHGAGNGPDAAGVASELVDAALSGKARDNITAAVLLYRSVDS